MRIVINAYSARLGGGQTYLINLLQHLPVQALELLVYAPQSLVLPSDPRIVRLDTAFPTTNPLLRSAWEKLVLPVALWRLRADVLFCPGGVVGTRVPRRCQVVTMFRNMIPFDMVIRKQVPFGLQRLRNWILARVMLKSMANADLVIFISDFARGVIEAQTPIRRGVTIAHGISAHFRQARAAAGPAPFGRGDYLLYVSRFDVYKNHYQLVEAYDALSAQLKQRYRLVLIGESDTPCGNQVRQLIAERGLESRVLIAGAVKYHDLPAIYSNSKLILFSSSCENCPNILLEALASGRPVLSSSVMPMPEFGGEAALYYDPKDVAAIRDRMQEVLEDEVLAVSLGQRALARSRRYEWATAASQTWASIMALKAPAPVEQTTLQKII